MFRAFPGFPKSYVDARKKNGILAKRIVPDDIRWREHKKRDKEELSRTRLISREDFDIPLEINIYNNKNRVHVL